MEDEIVTFFAALDRQVQNLEYGTVSGTVLVAKGRPVTHTLNLVLSKRKRYKTGNTDYPTKKMLDFEREGEELKSFLEEEVKKIPKK